MQNSRDLLILLRQIRWIQGIKVMTSAEDTEQKSRSDLVWATKSGQRCLQSPAPGPGPAARVETSFLRWGHSVNLPQLHSRTSCREEEWEVLLFFPVPELVQGTLRNREMQGMLQRDRQAAGTHLNAAKCLFTRCPGHHSHIVTSSCFRKTIPSLLSPLPCHSLLTPRVPLPHTVSCERAFTPLSSASWQEQSVFGLSFFFFFFCFGNFTVIFREWLFEKHEGYKDWQPTTVKCNWPLPLAPVPKHTR